MQEWPGGRGAQSFSRSFLSEVADFEFGFACDSQGGSMTLSLTLPREGIVGLCSLTCLLSKPTVCANKIRSLVLKGTGDIDKERAREKESVR